MCEMAGARLASQGSKYKGRYKKAMQAGRHAIAEEKGGTRILMAARTCTGYT